MGFWTFRKPQVTFVDEQKLIYKTLYHCGCTLNETLVSGSILHVLFWFIISEKANQFAHSRDFKTVNFTLSHRERVAPRFSLGHEVAASSESWEENKRLKSTSFFKYKQAILNLAEFKRMILPQLHVSSHTNRPETVITNYWLLQSFTCIQCDMQLNHFLYHCGLSIIEPLSLSRIW